MVVKNAKKQFYKILLGFQENICFLMKNTCFFCKNLFKVEFRRSRFFPAKSPYASEGKIDMFGSQKHIFLQKPI